MALSKAQIREILSAAGVDSEHLSEAVNKITDGHLASIEALREEVSGLKEEVANYKGEAEKLPAVQKELDDLKEEVAADAKEREGKDYDKLKEEFEQYKTDIENKAVRASKEAAYVEILKDAGIPEKHHAKILKYSDVDGIELDDKGKAKNAKELLKSVQEEWGDHVETVKTEGAKTETPPANNGGTKKTKEEILNIQNTAERQQAMIDNAELFGL